MQDAEKRVGVTTDLSYVICIRYGSLHARLSSVTKSRRPSIYRRGGRFSPLHQFTVSGGRDLQCKIRGEPSRLVISPRTYSAERYRPRRDRPISSRPRLEIRPGDLTGATQLVKESDSRPRRTFYTPPPLVSNLDETEACRPRPDAITRTPRAESRNFSIL